MNEKLVRMLRYYQGSEIEQAIANRDVSSSLIYQPNVYTGTDIRSGCPNWTLEYWTAQWGIGELPPCLDIEDIKKLIKSKKFYELESFVREKLLSLKDKFGITDIKPKIVESQDNGEDLLLMEISVREKDPKKQIEIWKNISNAIRSEIDRQFGDKSKEIQMKLWISLSSR